MSAARPKRLPAVAVAPERVDGPRVGRVASFRGGAVTVSFEGSGGPRAARVAAGLDDAALAQAAHRGAEALLLFEDGDPSRPIVVALLRSETPLLDAVLASPLPAAPRVARIDGERVLLEGEDEVELRCGKASLTLRRDGKVVLRGVDVVTEARGVQRIRGGKVQIN